MSDLEFRLAAIRKRLKDNPRFNPPISIKKVIELEQKYEIELPVEYRAFVTTVANGGRGMLSLESSLNNPLCIGCTSQINNDFFRTPFPHTSAYVPDEDPHFIEIDEKYTRGEITELEFELACNYLAAGTMIIHDQGCGNYTRLVITGATRGQVWTDAEAGGQGYLPINREFLDWFEGE